MTTTSTPAGLPPMSKDEARLIARALRERADTLRETVAAPTPTPSKAMFGATGSAALAELVEAGRLTLSAEAEDLDLLAERIRAHVDGVPS